MSLVGQNWSELLDNVAQPAELAVNLDAYAKILRDHERHQRMMADDPYLTVTGTIDPQWQYLQDMQANLSAQVGFINDTARRVGSVEFGSPAPPVQDDAIDSRNRP
ncbi:hypothetical protein ACWDTI_04615 [Gordonia sp. NPDC003424]